jgi:hypothetical protein
MQPMMNFNDQYRSCHPERSEESDAPGTAILRCAQDDRLLAFRPLTDLGCSKSSPVTNSDGEIFPISFYQ